MMKFGVQLCQDSREKNEAGVADAPTGFYGYRGWVVPVRPGVLRGRVIFGRGTGAEQFPAFPENRHKLEINLFYLQPWADHDPSSTAMPTKMSCCSYNALLGVGANL